jgi:TPR repeat protein
LASCPWTAAAFRRTYAEAANWFRKAADQGLAAAQTNLGGLYAEGKGVQPDIVLSCMWFTLAAAQGDEVAVKHREMIVAQMTKDQIAEAERLTREWKPTP